jgi:uncharacterized protein
MSSPGRKSAAADPLNVFVGEIPSQGLRLHGEVALVDVIGPWDEDERVTWPGVLRFDLLVTRVSGGVLAAGGFGAALTCRCDRCLAGFELPVHQEQACYYFENYSEDWLDLTDSVREDILLALPQRFLCREDCAGICPGCGCNLNEEECTCPGGEPDENPWAALDRVAVTGSQNDPTDE